jgi:hypothetical protein
MNQGIDGDPVRSIPGKVALTAKGMFLFRPLS